MNDWENRGSIGIDESYFFFPLATACGIYVALKPVGTAVRFMGVKRHRTNVAYICSFPVNVIDESYATSFSYTVMLTRSPKPSIRGVSLLVAC